MSDEKFGEVTLKILDILEVCSNSTMKEYTKKRNRVHKILIEFQKEQQKNIEKSNDDYERILIKFDNCRACLALTYNFLYKDLAIPPDDCDNAWHEWLIEKVEAKIKIQEESNVKN